MIRLKADIIYFDFILWNNYILHLVFGITVKKKENSKFPSVIHCGSEKIMWPGIFKAMLCLAQPISESRGTGFPLLVRTMKDGEC